MSIFKDETKKRKKPEPKPLLLMTKFQKEAQEAAHHWLLRNFYEHNGYSADKIQHYVECLLERVFEKLVLETAGIKSDWNQYEVRYDSPLKDLIKELTVVKAKQLVAAYSEELKKKKPTLSPAFSKAIKASYEDAFERSIRDAAVARGQYDAAEQVNELMKDILKAPLPEEDDR